MDVSSLTSSSPSQSSHAAALEKAGLTREQFLKILVAELSNQDPTNPMDNKELLGQMTSIENLQATSELTDSLGGLKDMIRFESLNSANGLVGRVIRGTPEGAGSGESVVGQVQRVVMRGDVVTLVVNGTAYQGTTPVGTATGVTIPVANVDEVLSHTSYVDMSGLGSAAGLIGKKVRGIPSGVIFGEGVEGIVKRVKVTDAGLYLVVNGRELKNGELQGEAKDYEVSLEQIEEVFAADDGTAGEPQG